MILPETNRHLIIGRVLNIYLETKTVTYYVYMKYILITINTLQYTFGRT